MMAQRAPRCLGGRQPPSGCSRRTIPCATLPGLQPVGALGLADPVADAHAHAPGLDRRGRDRPGQRARRARARAAPRRPTGRRRRRASPLGVDSHAPVCRRGRGTTLPPVSATTKRSAGAASSSAGVASWRSVPSTITATRSASARGVGEVVGDQQRRDARGRAARRRARRAPRGACAHRARRAARRAAGPRAPRQRARQRDPLALAAAEPAGRSAARRAIRSRASSESTVAASAPENATFARTVKCGNNAWCWGT